MPAHLVRDERTKTFSAREKPSVEISDPFAMTCSSALIIVRENTQYVIKTLVIVLTPLTLFGLSDKVSKASLCKHAMNDVKKYVKYVCL